MAVDQEQAEAGVQVVWSGPNAAGYRGFTLGGFTFGRDDYFVYVDWPTGSHVLALRGS